MVDRCFWFEPTNARTPCTDDPPNGFPFLCEETAEQVYQHSITSYPSSGLACGLSRYNEDLGMIAFGARVNNPGARTELVVFDCNQDPATTPPVATYGWVAPGDWIDDLHVDVIYNPTRDDSALLHSYQRSGTNWGLNFFPTDISAWEGTINHPGGTNQMYAWRGQRLYRYPPTIRDGGGNLFLNAQNGTGSWNLSSFLITENNGAPSLYVGPHAFYDPAATLLDWTSIIPAGRTMAITQLFPHYYQHCAYTPDSDTIYWYVMAKNTTTHELVILVITMTWNVTNYNAVVSKQIPLGYYNTGATPDYASWLEWDSVNNRIICMVSHSTGPPWSTLIDIDPFASGGSEIINSWGWGIGYNRNPTLYTMPQHGYDPNLRRWFMSIDNRVFYIDIDDGASGLVTFTTPYIANYTGGTYAWHSRRFVRDAYVGVTTEWKHVSKCFATA